MGDVMHALPTLSAVHALWPGVRCDWVVESLSAPLLAGHPLLDRVLVLPRKEWRKALGRPGGRWKLAGEVRRFVHELRAHRYDLILDLQGNLRSSCLMGLARARRRWSHHSSEVKDRTGWLPVRRPSHPSGRVHRVVKHLHLLRALGWEGPPPTPVLPDFSAEREALFARCPELADSTGLVILHPFASAFGRYKEWPVPSAAALARTLADRGQTCWISCGPSDRPAAEAIVRASGNRARMLPETGSLREVAALVQHAKLLVGVDTGILHLAAALGRPVIGLYGPKDPATYGPWSAGSGDGSSEGGPSTVIRARVPCAPCLLRRCEHAICMQMIEPDEVAGLVLAARGATHTPRGVFPP